MLSYIYKKAILTYLISQILNANDTHQIAFSRTPNTHSPADSYTTGVTSTGTPENARSKNYI